MLVEPSATPLQAVLGWAAYMAALLGLLGFSGAHVYRGWRRH